VAAVVCAEIVEGTRTATKMQEAKRVYFFMGATIPVWCQGVPLLRWKGFGGFDGRCMISGLCLLAK